MSPSPNDSGTAFEHNRWKKVGYRYLRRHCTLPDGGWLHKSPPVMRIQEYLERASEHKPYDPLSMPDSQAKTDPINYHDPGISGCILTLILSHPALQEGLERMKW